MYWDYHPVQCGGLVGGGKMDAGMDDYKGMEIEEEKDGKQHF